MQELSEPKASHHPEFHNKRPNPFAPIEIVILRRINEIKPRDPANYAGREYNRGKIDPTSLRDPCADGCDSQREAEKEMRCARESFCERIEKNQSQSNWRKSQSQSINCGRCQEKASRTDRKQHNGS